MQALSLRAKAYLIAFISGVLLSALLVMSNVQMKSLQSTSEELYKTNTSLRSYVHLTGEIEKLKGLVQRYQTTLSPNINDEIVLLNERIDLIIEKPLLKVSKDLLYHIETLKMHLKSFRNNFDRLKYELTIQEALHNRVMENGQILEMNFREHFNKDKALLSLLQNVEVNFFRYLKFLDHSYATNVRKQLGNLELMIQKENLHQEYRESFALFKESSLRALQHQSTIMMLSDVVMPGNASEIIFNAYKVQDLSNKQIEQINHSITKLTTKTSQMIMIIGVIFLLSIFFTAWLIIRTVTLPIVNLTYAFDKIIHGETDFELPDYNIDDEVGKLTDAAKTFNQQSLQLKKLSREQEGLLSLFDKGEAVLFKWKNDDDWNVETVSSNSKTLLGYSNDLFLKQKILYTQIIHPDDLKGVKLEISKAIDNNEEFFRHNPYRVITKDGGEKWILHYTVMQRDAHGVITDFIGYMIDFTQQKLYESSLRTQTIKLQLASSSANMGVWTLNLIDNTVQWDENMYSLYGLEGHESEENYSLWKNALVLKDLVRAEKKLREAIDSDSNYDDLFRIKHPNGTMRFIKATGILEYDEKGQKIAMVGTNIDITEIEMNKQALILAKEEAEKANSAKSDFLANMSHEIRTPLNGVIGLTDLVLRSELTKHQRNYLEQVMYSSKNLLHIINDILDFSKIEAGKLEIESIPVSLESVMKNSVNLYSFLAKEKGIALDLTLDNRLKKTVNGDPVRLQQILNNLISNAVKFTQKGHILVEAKLLKSYENEVKVGFSVSDNGIGIDPEKIDHLFEAFTQSDSSDSRKFGGTGLGLAICKRLSELMGGTIEVKSTKGEGSVFSFTIMFEWSDVELDDRSELESIANQKIHSYVDEVEQIQEKHKLIFDANVLVAEDNSVNQLVVKDYLNSFGCEVTIAENGLEAIKALDLNDYDVIFMDIQMPVMDGYEASRKIRESNTKIPIIALSAAVLERDKKASLDAGMNDHIAKPIDPQQLQNVLKKYFDARAVVDQKQSSFTLPEIEGIDTKALVTLFHDKTTIHKLLQTFFHGYEDVQSKFSSSLPIDRLRKNIHTLKGSSGNLQMKKLYQDLCVLNDSEDSYIMEHVVELQTQLEQILENLGTYLSTVEDSYTSMEKGEAFNLLRELSSKLEEGSFISANEREQYFSALIACSTLDDAKNISNLIDKYIFDEAKKELDILLEANGAL